MLDAVSKPEVKNMTSPIHSTAIYIQGISKLEEIRNRALKEEENELLKSLEHLETIPFIRINKYVLVKLAGPEGIPQLDHSHSEFYLQIDPHYLTKRVVVVMQQGQIPNQSDADYCARLESIKAVATVKQNWIQIKEASHFSLSDLLPYKK